MVSPITIDLELRHDSADAHLDSIPWLIKQFNCKVIAEIGVERGALAKQVFEDCDGIIREYYLIDPWRPYDAPLGTYFSQDKFKDYACWDDLALHVYGQFMDKARIIRLPSVFAAKLFADSGLDLVFIDANHTRESVAEDIEAWLPKLKQAGILAGHDYDNKLFPGVREAVESCFPKEILEVLPGMVWYIEIAKAGRYRRSQGRKGDDIVAPIKSSPNFQE